MSGHTPGPWMVRPKLQGFDHSGGIVDQVAGGDDESICMCMCAEGESMDANARLIAASPDLFLRFEWLLARMADDGGDIWCAIREHEGAAEWIAGVRAAIAKAKGAAR